MFRTDFIDAIGNTPLIKLTRASEVTGCTILGKAEFLNPGGSVKDRAALAIVRDAEERGYRMAAFILGVVSSDALQMQKAGAVADAASR